MLGVEAIWAMSGSATADVLRFDEAAARRLEAVYITPDVVAQRCAILRMLDLRPGERVIDIGCGTGLLAADLALLVGHAGRVVGIDVSSDTLALARRRCAAWPWVELLEGDVRALPGGDGAFYVAVSTQVLEYVPDVDRALAEIVRVLRPGGRALVLDSDWEGLILNADDGERHTLMLDAWRAHASHQSLPLSLPSRLRQAGLDVVRRELLTMFDTSLTAHSYAGGIVGFITAFAVKKGKVTDAQAVAWLDDLRTVDARDDFVLVLPRFVFLAVKPA